MASSSSLHLALKKIPLIYSSEHGEERNKARENWNPRGPGRPEEEKSQKDCDPAEGWTLGGTKDGEDQRQEARRRREGTRAR